MKKRILVTGATGFVGKFLCDYLLQNTFDFDIKKVNRHELHEDLECSFLKNIDIVVHLAAKVHCIDKSMQGSLADYRKINVDLTKRLANASAKNGVEKFIYLSSIKVNGENTLNSCFTEKDKVNPQGNYAISKTEAEKALLHISNQTNLKVIILRAPLVYGPGVKANFLKLLQVVSKQYFLPFKSIHNKRSFIYVKNLIDIIILAMGSKNTGKVYLVSDNEIVSTQKLIEMLSVAMDRKNRSFIFPEFLLKIGLTFIGKKHWFDRLLGSLVIDNSYIKQELHWTPSYTLEQGLQETVDWYTK